MAMEPAGNDESGREPQKPPGMSGVVGMPIGAGAGVALGLVFDNLALGIAIGSCVGLVIGLAVEKARNSSG